MKAFVTSIGEPTTDLCVWSLERLGYEVVIIQGDTTLKEKLEQIYTVADDDFLRVDADVIVNRNVLKLGQYEKDAWWVQPQTFDWYKMDISHGGIQLIRKKALNGLREAIRGADQDRPETYVWRSPHFYSPRRCVSVDLVCGLNGWGQKDVKRIRAIKARRSQLHLYDFELAERLNV